MKSNIQLSPNKYVENMTKMFNKLYTEEQLTDITLWCKDGVIKAHKVVLATSSPYFHKIFLDNNRDNLVIVMHGINYQHLHNIIELIYKGNVEVLAEDVNPIYELAGELQLSDISGVLLQETEEITQNDGNHCRDTRFKGLKRVAVDYSESENAPKKIEIAQSNDNLIKIETEEPKIQQITEKTIEEPPKLSAWAKKQRKFKCNLCPSSFKRSSHLTRHQLVHTGERPFACDQCDKAFSRHDKLKHHIRKAHEAESEAFEYNNEPHSTPLPFVISHVTSESTLESNDTPAKRGRGRPRKYPLMPKPLIKRGRGRPRLNPVSQGVNGENYDITNLPFGDLEYLTMPILPQTSEDSVIIEPFVEIKTDKDEIMEKNEEKISKEEQIKHENIITKIAKIGECTISVANH